MLSARLDLKTERTNAYRVPDTMKAWTLAGPEELTKPVPEPGAAEVLVRVDAIAVCATDIEILRHGVPAMIDGEVPRATSPDTNTWARWSGTAMYGLDVVG